MKSFLIAITVALVAALCIFSVQGGKPLHCIKLNNGVTGGSVGNTTIHVAIHVIKVNDIERFIVCTQLTLLDPHQTIVQCPLGLTILHFLQTPAFRLKALFGGIF